MGRLSHTFASKDEKLGIETMHFLLVSLLSYSGLSCSLTYTSDLTDPKASLQQYCTQSSVTYSGAWPEPM